MPGYISLSDVQKGIADHGLDWEAGVTPVSGVAADVGDVGLFGLAVPDSEIAEEMSAALAREAELAFWSAATPPPTSIDWRAHLGRDWMTPIRDQGTCGACVSFATCAALEARARIAADDAGAAIDLSEADLFFNGCGPCCRTGWQPARALERARHYGVGAEASFPYVQSNQAPRPVAPILKVSGWIAVSTMDDRRHAVAEGPVICGIEVRDDFLYYRNGIYRHAAGVRRGLHAMCVCGYDDQSACWIVKNSWGTGWGEAGYVRVGYREIGIDTMFPFYVPTVAWPLHGGALD